MKYNFHIKSAFARRIPDPNFKSQYNMETYMFLVRCRDLPAGISNDPNARPANIAKLTYKKVAESLLEQDGDDAGTFHLKNKGITIVADEVKQTGNNDEYTISLESGEHGIVDGGHTYEIIQENKDEIPENQYVRVDVRVGTPPAWIPMISGGLNTAVQVQTMSLENLKSSFNWMQQALGARADLIAWSENETGKYLDARDLVAVLAMLNVELCPNDKPDHPTFAYTSKEKTLERYIKSPKVFEGMGEIISDALVLLDTISSTAIDVYNASADVSRGGGLKIMESKKRGNFEFQVLGTEGQYRLAKPALYPILASFRWFVVKDPHSYKMSWATDFSKILKFWETEGREMITIAADTSKDLGYVLNALGKNTGLWKTLH
ncbi:MAG: AIPR family protein, partial [Parvibaculales bacterium]